MTIREFIKANHGDYDRYRSRGMWNGYNVYYVWAQRNEGLIVGLPQFALEKNGKFRMANPDEIFSIMSNNHKQHIKTGEQIAVIKKLKENKNLSKNN